MVATLILYLIIMFIEGQILVPTIEGKQFEIHPAWVLVLILVGLALVGPLGAILALAGSGRARRSRPMSLPRVWFEPASTRGRLSNGGSWLQEVPHETRVRLLPASAPRSWRAASRSRRAGTPPNASCRSCRARSPARRRGGGIRRRQDGGRATSSGSGRCRLLRADDGPAAGASPLKR
jgi:hypothetical protein